MLSLSLSLSLSLCRNLKIDVTFPKSVLTLWTSVARQRGVECIIESGIASIAYLIQLTPYTDGLIRRPNRSWTIISFSGSVKDLIVFIEKKDKISKVCFSKAKNVPSTFLANHIKLITISVQARGWHNI